MTDNNIATEFPMTSTLAAITSQRDVLIEQLERTKTERDRIVDELSMLKRSLQQDLADWAENNLDSGDDSYKELSELMENNGLEGLKRQYIVTVRVTYEFEVEVEASSEDEAQSLVDDDIFTYANDNVRPGWDTPYDSEFEVNEA